MKTPIFIRPLIENERRQIQAGLRSKDAFVLRGSQVLLASARGERAPAIASQFGSEPHTGMYPFRSYPLAQGFSAPAVRRLVMCQSCWRDQPGNALEE